MFSMAAMTLVLAGCAGKPLAAAKDDGTYCYRVNNGWNKRRTCTPTAIPSAAIEAQAKALQPDATTLTVYVVRRRWSDARNVLDISVDDRLAASIVPYAFARFRMPPGAHRVSTAWAGTTIEQTVTGNAGDVVIVEIVGSLPAWRSSYRLEQRDLVASKDQILASRLVADLDLRMHQ